MITQIMHAFEALETGLGRGGHQNCGWHAALSRSMRDSVTLQHEAPMLQDTLATTAARAEPVSMGTAIKSSLTGAFAMMFLWLPRIIGFIIILLIGWLISSLIAKAIATALRAIKLNDVVEKVGINTSRMASGTDAAGIVAAAVKWLIRFIVLLVAFDILGLPAVSDVLRQFLMWLPNLIVAIVVLVLAGLAARALGNIVRGMAAEAGFSNPDTLANVAKSAVWVFAIVIAVNQIGIATTLVNTLFVGAVGAVALASGLAFGLGGRDLASRTLENWYEAAQDSRDKIDNLDDDSPRRGRAPNRP